MTALEALVGARPLAVLMKSIDLLDGHCRHLLRCAPFAVLGACDPAGRARAIPVGGAAGFAEALDEHHLRLQLPEPLALDLTVGCSLVFLVPGLGETLRINGRASLDGLHLTLRVEEAFVHCAKSILRSSLWSASAPTAPIVPLPSVAGSPLSEPALRTFLAASPFVVLTSWDATGAADASPKGDPRGFLRVDADGRLLVPDRPGNRRTDTFHNLLEQPRVALLALSPGDERAAELTGRASLTSAPELLAEMAVEGKTPKLALRLELDAAKLFDSPAVRDARLWDPARHVPRSALPRIADVFIDHVKQNKQRGLAATAVRTLASKTMMRVGLEHDYEKNRY